MSNVIEQQSVVVEKEEKLSEQAVPSTSIEVTEASVPSYELPLDEETRKRVEAILDRTPIVLLIKGDADRPFCKFSKKMVSLMISRGVHFSSFDVKSLDQNDEEQKKLYMGFKQYGRFPTFPQLYVNRELVGGLDICTSLDEENELISTIRDLLPNAEKCLAKKADTPISNDSTTTAEIVQVNMRYFNGAIQILHMPSDSTVEKLYENVLNHFNKFDSQFKKPFLIAYPGLGKKVLDKNYLDKTIRECFSKEEFEQDLKTSDNCKIVPLTICYLPTSSVVNTTKKPLVTSPNFLSTMIRTIFKVILSYTVQRPAEMLKSTWTKLMKKFI